VGGWAPLALRRFPTVVAAEILILVVAVGAAGLLTAVPTAREIAAATKQTELHTATVDGLFVTFELLSSGADQSRLIVRSHSTVKVEQAPVSAVSVTLSGPDGATRTVLLERIEAGRYEGETAQPTPGAWEAALALKRGGLPDAVTQVGWTVSAARPEGASSLEVVTSALAILLLTATLGAVGFARRRKPDNTSSRPEMSEAMGSVR
jgi:hypothetical protein